MGAKSLVKRGWKALLVTRWPWQTHLFLLCDSSPSSPRGEYPAPCDKRAHRERTCAAEVWRGSVSLCCCLEFLPRITLLKYLLNNMVPDHTFFTPCSHTFWISFCHKTGENIFTKDFIMILSVFAVQTKCNFNLKPAVSQNKQSNSQLCSFFVIFHINLHLMFI